MHYKTKYQFLVRVLQSGQKLYYKNSTGTVSCVNGVLIGHWCDYDTLIDEYNINHIYNSCSHATYQHAYKIIDGKYKHLKTYTTYTHRPNTLKTALRKFHEKFGDDIIIIPTTFYKVTLDGLEYLEDGNTNES